MNLKPHYPQPLIATPTTTQTPPTMSSLEIAELTGKQHKDVLRDIKRTLEAEGTSTAQFCALYTASNGKQNPCYRLPFRETHIVMGGYSVKHRAAIIDRWIELEQQAKITTNPLLTLPDFNNPIAMARAWADELEAKQEALPNKR